MPPKKKPAAPALAPDETFPVEMVPLSELRAHPRNYRRHPEAQLAHLRQSVIENRVYRPVVIARDGTILAGHGLTAVLRDLGRIVAPCVRLDVDAFSPAALKVLAGDNGIGALAEDDDRMLYDLLRDIAAAPDATLDGTGHDPDGLDAMLASLDAAPVAEAEPERTANYSRKIVAPIYTPTGDRPPVAALFDRSRTDALLAQIDAAKLPPDLDAFLRSAAERHTRFRFDQVAEFYAHAAPDVQALMEDSALVIIDFDRAVELGFVRLTEKMLAENPAGVPEDALPDPSDV